jgi:Tol biopolymer transport system component
MNRHIDRLDPAFDPRIADWLEADPDQAPAEVLDTVLAAMQSIPQRRASRAPGRFPEMFTPARAAVAAVLGVLLIGGAILAFQRPGTSNVGGPVPSPSVTANPSLGGSPSLVPGGSPLGLAIVELDGSLRQELRLPVDAWMADLSPDGSRIAFTTSDKSVAFCGACGGTRYPVVVETGASAGNFLYPDGGSLPFEMFGHPSWSPDGSKLAFQGVAEDGNVDIYVADIETADRSMAINVALRRLTTDPAIDEFPAWTPDGRTILYANYGADPPNDDGFSFTQEIWTVAVEGGEPTRLTTNDVPDTMPDVRSDGLVAFWRDGETWSMTLDGADQNQLLTVEHTFNPRWSPDGTRLALLRYDPKDRARYPAAFGLGADYPLLEVIVVDPTTGEITVVGPRVASDVNPPSWTADGEALLITRYDDGS